MNPVSFSALAATPLLAGLEMNAIELLAEEGIVRSFAEGEWIVKEGDAGHSFFILVEGDVEVIKNHGCPHEVNLATLRAGTFFGEMCVVDPVPRTASVRAILPVHAVEIKAGTLYHLFEKMPAQYAIMILNLARDMARRLRSIDEAFAAKA